MNKFGLIGETLTYSFSQNYFTKKFKSESILNSVYDLYELSDIRLFPDLINANQSFRGLNVTIPYKESIIPHLDRLENEASEIQAVNTIIFKNDELIGANTDVIGFKRSLAAVLKPHHERALILGTGGASKAVSYALSHLGVDYLFVSRNPEENQFSYADLDKYVLKHHPLIINTTPVGTFPNVNECPAIPYELLTADHLLYDLVYNPEVSLFLKKGLAQGSAIINGYRMLVLQAEASWTLWNS